MHFFLRNSGSKATEPFLLSVFSNLVAELVDKRGILQLQESWLLKLEGNEEFDRTTLVYKRMRAK